MSKPDAPPPPDYKGAAHEQGQANIDAALVSAGIGSPDTTTPFGSVAWSNPSYDAALQSWQAGMPTGTGASKKPYAFLGALANPQSPLDLWQAKRPDIASFAQPGMFHKTINLSPELQALYKRATGSPIDFSSLPGGDLTSGGGDAARQRVEDAAYRRETRYLDPQREAREADLLNRGFNMGSEGYNQNLGQFDEQYGDARDRAILLGGQEQDRLMGQRGEALRELLTQRGLPLQELSQIAGFLPSTGGSGPSIAGAPVADATQAAYQAAMQNYGIKANQAGGEASAAAGLGTAAIIAALCDPALKTDVQEVEPVLDKLLNIPVKEFTYVPEVGMGGLRFVGPMADSWAKQFGGSAQQIQLLSMMGVMMKAIQELTAEVRALQQK